MLDGALIREREGSHWREKEIRPSVDHSQTDTSTDDHKMFKYLASVSKLAVSRSAFTQASRQAIKPSSAAVLINNGLFQNNRQVRFYSHAPELTKEIISERIIELLESYSKTAENVKITDETSFSKDLGFDSFDTVEVIMEIEYEFSILIPDKEADEIKTVGQAVDFISKQHDAC